MITENNASSSSQLGINSVAISDQQQLNIFCRAERLICLYEY